MPRLKVTIAYDGTEFHGWQRQEPPGAPALRTVQGVLEEACRIVFAAPVAVVGASRTDAGVHAVGQVAALDVADRIPLERVPLALNARLPDDVQVLDAAWGPDGFDPISHAVSKCYRYSIACPAAGYGLPPLFERRYVCWHVKPLDVEAMGEAAGHFVGRHDFRAVAHQVHRRESSVRSIHQCTVRSPLPGRIEIDIAGDGFLYNMVRIIAGTLRDVGRGRIPPAAIPEILAAGDRGRAGQTLPPGGLCLRWVHYGLRDRPDHAQIA